MGSEKKCPYLEITWDFVSCLNTLGRVSEKNNLVRLSRKNNSAEKKVESKSVSG